MKLRLLFIAVFSGLVPLALWVFGMSGILNTAEAAGSLEPYPARSGAIDTTLAVPRAMTAPTSVSIVPEKLAVVDRMYTFVATVSPADATQPISYTWETSGAAVVVHTGGVTDTIGFTWSISGMQTVTVTARNDWGTVTDTYTVFVSDLPPLDTALVFDVSGSMDYETNCFGCFTEDPTLSSKILANPFPNNGTFNPLRYGGVVPAWGKGTPAGDLSKAGDNVCSAAVDYVVSGAYKYSVHEAELYSGIGTGNVYDSRPWRLDIRQPGQGFWVLQRPLPGVAASNDVFMRPHAFVTYSQRDLVDVPRLQGGAYNSECWDPGTNDLSGKCWKTTGDSLIPPETAPSTPPFLEYDFTVDWEPDTTHIWIRAIAGHSRSETWSGQIRTNDLDWRDTLYFQVIDGATSVKGPIGGGVLNSLLNQRSSNLRFLEPGLVSDFPAGDTDRWRWVKINNFALTLTNGRYTLRIYQGSTAFNLDKIIITNDPIGVFNTAQTDFLTGGTLGPDATDGSATREACNVCNPMYGQTITDGPNQCSCKYDLTDTASNPLPGLAEGSALNCTGVTEPTDMLLDDLFHDVDPFRSAQEAVKYFTTQLDPRLDQLGMVAFNDGITGSVDMQCLRVEQLNGNQKACFDPLYVGPHPESATLGFTGPITYARLIQAVEDQSAGGTTDISEGMRDGLRELGINVGTTITHQCDGSANDACDRQGAAQRVLILVNDGTPNTNVGGVCVDNIIWRGLIGYDTDPYNCSMYYAREAADHGVAVYTVGLGPGVDPFLLRAMAEGEVPLPDPTQPCDPITNSNGHPCGDNGAYFVQSCGAYFPATRPTDLDAIFDQILILARSCAASRLGPGAEPLYLPVIMKQ